jgi:hypothetical protein
MKIHSFMIIAGLLIITNIAVADKLIIDRVYESEAFNVPQRGLSMNQVTTTYGEPLMKFDSIGNPPITKWEYPDFLVYFERSWVIRSVVKKPMKPNKDPKQ